MVDHLHRFEYEYEYRPFGAEYEYEFALLPPPDHVQMNVKNHLPTPFFNIEKHPVARFVYPHFQSHFLCCKNEF